MGRSPAQHAEDEAFEEEVLRIARAVFAPHQPHQGAAVVSGRERDGIIHGDDIVVAIEATTSRALDKAKKDGSKLKEACEGLARQHRFKAVKGYFVTRDEPTAQQRDAISALRAPVIACSFAQFRSHLIDSRDYLDSRQNYPFGSARNPGTGSATELDDYISIGFTTSSATQAAPTLRLPDLIQRMSDGKSSILLGDFGAGKSMTLREVHLKLQAEHFKNPLAPFPMTLNLRDHQGQQDPDEAIRRHASKLGFDNPTKLVRAWRAGQVHVLLDGFDEIAASGWRGQTPNLSRIRRDSVEVVRRFAEETPVTVGFMVSGRRHFFDSDLEMRGSLGLSSRNAAIAITDDFTEEQVREYLEAHDWTGQLPAWLPNHPLLLGYLASARALESLATGAGDDPAVGWNLLLDKLCEREARIEQGLDGSTIRRVLERVATIARSHGSGNGPVHPADLANAFEQVAGYPPDEGSYQVLQRLPGLGVLDPSDGSRFFIDESLADAARAADVIRYAAAYDSVLETQNRPAVPLRSLGVSVAAFQAREGGVTASQVQDAAVRLKTRGGSDTYSFDLVRLALELGTPTLKDFLFAELDVESLVLDQAGIDVGGLTFRDCLIEVLDLTEFDGDTNLPSFEQCVIGTVHGAASVAALPAGRFIDCTFEAFDPSSKTTRGILAMPGLNPRQKVMLTILKKVYMQSGSGRKESALTRGLDPALRGLVSDALDRLVAAEMLIETRSAGAAIYLPSRGQRARVRGILESPGSIQDAVVRDY